MNDFTAFRVMRSYTSSNGDPVDECVASYATHAAAYAHALRLKEQEHSVWIEERKP